MVNIKRFQGRYYNLGIPGMHSEIQDETS